VKRCVLLLILLTTIASHAEGKMKIKGNRYVAVTGQGFFPVAQLGPKGEVLVVLRGGAPHIGMEGRLDLVSSRTSGRTWTKPRLIVDSPLDDRNPAFAVMPDGALVVGYSLCDAYVNGEWRSEVARFHVFVTRSGDGGKTWTRPTLVNVSPYDDGSPFGKMVLMPDGTLLMNVYCWYLPAYGGDKPEEKRGEFTLVFRSRDGGKTWGDPSLIAKGFNETALLLMPDGRLLAAMRSDAAGGIWQCESSDGGRTWSEPTRITRPAEQPGDLVLLPSGHVLLVFGQRNEPFGTMGMVSKDGGKTWGEKFTLWDDAVNTDCGYPSAVVLPDGRILVVYYTVGSKKRPDWGTCAPVVVFRESDLP
jgi:Neuraminidase (sialidase)